jgi:hypothetical protein
MNFFYWIMCFSWSNEKKKERKKRLLKSNYRTHNYTSHLIQMETSLAFKCRCDYRIFVYRAVLSAGVLRTHQ